MSKFKGKKVLVVGFGLSGVAVTRYMCKQGARVTVTDSKQKTELNDSIKAVAELKIEYDLGKHTNKTFHTSDMIVVSPGVPLNIRPLEEAREMNVQVTTEVELAASVLKEPLIAVTGTNGKTTVTTLIGEMFKADGKPAYVGGNIGRPLLDYVTDGPKSDYVVAELSSFQLELVRRMVPACAVFTNIEPDHLDRYVDMNAYIAAKKRLLAACDRNSYVVLNHDDPIVSSFASECPGKVLWFTKRDPMSIGGEFAERFHGAYFIPGSTEIVAKINGKEERYNLAKLKLFGDHNRENVMAALCACRMMGVSAQAIQKVIDEFDGVSHRLEFVRRKGGVFFINDSKATNPASLQRSLQAFKKNPVILVAGGKDKDLDFTPLAELVRRRVKILILLGEAKEKMNRAIGDLTETYLVGTFEEAVLLAYQKSRSGDIIMLAPGCSSLDMFRNYEERGDYFKKLVHQL
ncbi:MAG: UDP-N-acetylmuramoyl-L-alanine--D-glutamate ligase [Bdellovibrionales bacterium]|nr:UDP-N-acetylmuramoyl-L-alanine--D-glutamate ligase [Bdellovibrionales bacterium]